MTTPALMIGEVLHHRLRPVRNRFRYPVFFLRCDPLRLDAMERGVLSVDRFNLMSFHRADHGPRDGSALGPWLHRLLDEHGLACAKASVSLYTMPRVLGYVFNPVSFWMCRDHAGALRAVLCEVNNTFGERHSYLVAHPDGAPIRPDDWLAARKVFHVSPFFKVEGGYRFRFRDGAEGCDTRIDYHDADGRVLVTRMSGAAQPLTSARLLGAFARHPWHTVGVVARIHIQALRLWLKGVPFVAKPVPPQQEITR